MGAEDPSDEEKIVLLSEVDGQAAENEEKQSGIFGHIISSLVAKNLQNQLFHTMAPLFRRALRDGRQGGGHWRRV